jgi:hypothetical protein
MASGSDEAYTVNEAWSRLGFGRFQALLLVLMGTGKVAEGMETMLLSFVGAVRQGRVGRLRRGGGPRHQRRLRRDCRGVVRRRPLFRQIREEVRAVYFRPVDPQACY